MNSCKSVLAAGDAPSDTTFGSKTVGLFLSQRSLRSQRVTQANPAIRRSAEYRTPLLSSEEADLRRAAIDVSKGAQADLTTATMVQKPRSVLGPKPTFVRFAANALFGPKPTKLLHRSECRLLSAARHNDGEGLCSLEGFAEDHLVVAYSPEIANTCFFFIAVLSVELACQREVIRARRVYDQDALPLFL